MLSGSGDTVCPQMVHLYAKKKVKTSSAWILSNYFHRWRKTQLKLCFHAHTSANENKGINNMCICLPSIADRRTREWSYAITFAYLFFGLFTSKFECSHVNCWPGSIDFKRKTHIYKVNTESHRIPGIYHK